MEIPTHWSFKLANADAALPVGSFEHFEQALHCLGPISSLHQELDPADWRHCVCIRCAGDEIQRLAVEYNENRILNRDAPRAKHVVNQAHLIQRSAEQLLDAILGMDDYCRKAFRDYGHHNEVGDLPVYAGYFDDGLPDPEDDSGSLWVQNLLGLRNAAMRVSTTFKQRRGAKQYEPADKGGNTNLFKENFGSPDRNLVIAGWRTFEKFRPKQAKGTEHGAFHEFLKHVFEYATGLDPEEYSSLSSWMKALASLLRQKDDMFDKYIAAEAELRFLKADPVADISRQREVAYQMSVVSADLEDINLLLKEARPGKKSTQS